MALTYPVDCDTPQERIEYLCILQSKLSLLRAFFTEWRDIGKTQVQYNKLPAKVRARFGYTQILPFSEFKRFCKEIWSPLRWKTEYQIRVQESILRASTTWTPDINEAIE